MVFCCSKSVAAVPPGGCCAPRCVYEAYLGTRWNKTCIMPARPNTSTQCGTIRRTVVAPVAAGLLLGLLWWVVLSGAEERDGFWPVVTTTMLACATGTAIGFMASLLLKVCRCAWWKHYTWVRRLHVLLLFLCTLSVFPWLRFKPGFSFAFDHFQHYFLPVVLCLFNLLRVAQLNQHQLELKAPGQLAVQFLFRVPCWKSALNSSASDMASCHTL